MPLLRYEPDDRDHYRRIQFWITAGMTICALSFATNPNSGRFLAGFGTGLIITGLSEWIDLS